MTKKITNKYELDIVILVAVKNEFLALMEWVKEMEESSEINFYQIPNDQINDADMIFEVEHSTGDILRYHVYKLPFPSMGSDATTYITTKTIYQIHPIVICMVGICAGDVNRTKYGDIIIACSTVRHDFGKLELNPESTGWIKRLFSRSSMNKMQLHFKHRLDTHSISGMDGSFFRLTDLIYLIEKYNQQLLNPIETRESDLAGKAHLGVFSTGNQVIKVPGVFEYFRKNNIEPNIGDEYQKDLLAIEMEAHSMVYAAQQAGNVGWLVVKGVADYADLTKNDEYHQPALSNAFNFLRFVLPDAVVQGFGRKGDRELHKNQLDDASAYYEDGDFTHAMKAVKKAYDGGLRTKSARKLYIKSLMRRGDYHEALRILEEQRNRIWYNDSTTIELIAEYLWRQGKYSDMKRLLGEIPLTTSTLLYLSAMALIFDESNLSDTKKMSNNLNVAKDAMHKAVLMTEAEPKFFININYFFACILLQKNRVVFDQSCTESYERAQRITLISIEAHPHRGLIYIYMLLLLAIADLPEEFDQFCLDNKQLHLVIALDNIDMVYKRIDLIYSETPDIAGKYISGISKFIADQHTLGKTIRSETQGRLEIFSGSSD